MVHTKLSNVKQVTTFIIICGVHIAFPGLSVIQISLEAWSPWSYLQYVNWWKRDVFTTLVLGAIYKNKHHPSLDTPKFIPPPIRCYSHCTPHECAWKSVLLLLGFFVAITSCLVASTLHPPVTTRITCHFKAVWNFPTKKPSNLPLASCLGWGHLSSNWQVTQRFTLNPRIDSTWISSWRIGFNALSHSSNSFSSMASKCTWDRLDRPFRTVCQQRISPWKTGDSNLSKWDEHQLHEPLVLL